MQWSLVPLILGATLMHLDSVSAGDWRSVVAERLPLYGHRNWVVIVDAAYPAQISQGIEMILCDDAQTDVVKGVLYQLSASKHVRPTCPNFLMEVSMNTRVRLFMHGLVLVLGLALIVGGIVTEKSGAIVIGLSVAAVYVQQFLKKNKATKDERLGHAP